MESQILPQHDVAGEECVDVDYLRKFQSTIVQYQAVLDDCNFSLPY